MWVFGNREEKLLAFQNHQQVVSYLESCTTQNRNRQRQLHVVLCK